MTTFRTSLAVTAMALLAGAAAPIGLRHDADVAKHDALYQTPAFKAVGRVFVGEKHSGTGTLITPTCVLTAAHVIDVIIEEGKEGFVELGGKKRRVKGMVNHPAHNTVEKLREGADYTKEVDMGLMFLEEPVTDIAPLPIHRGRDEIGKEIVMVGSGAYGVGPDVIRADRQRMQWSAGRNIIDSYGALQPERKFPNHAFLADFDGPDRPHLNQMGSATPLPMESGGSGGDSGGPWLLEVDGKWEIVGVFNFCTVSMESDFLKDGLYGSISGAMRVSDFKDWIDATMKSWK